MNRRLEKDEFLKKISELLAKTLCLKELNVKIDFETNLVNGVGENCLTLSSIDYVDFLVMVEKEYDIGYNFDTTIYTISDLYNYVNCYEAIENNEA